MENKLSWPRSFVTFDNFKRTETKMSDSQFGKTTTRKPPKHNKTLRTLILRTRYAKMFDLGSERISITFYFIFFIGKKLSEARIRQIPGTVRP